ncbi:hypothetical protein BRC90_11015 [Halobacteriales archaeon QS_4_69_34]|nr:MAG: hypothetical protein BRC90_11015 [Halobacteriales archaeon QS_4_69_34]
MTVDESAIRDRCTDAVYERGVNYREEGRIRELTRVGDAITAVVQGSRPYELALDLAADGFDPRCTCPYDGPRECKHVVAVLLDLADGLPADEGERIEAALEDVALEDLRAFVRDECARNRALRERFVAEFGDTSMKSAAEYREEVDRLFEAHTEEYPVVVEAIDFSRFADLAERHRERGNYRQAAAIHRALAEGIDENIHLVDAAYDHYAQTFTSALDAYVDCVSMADLGADEQRAHAEFLSERANTGSDYHREHFRTALEDLRGRENGRAG